MVIAVSAADFSKVPDKMYRSIRNVATKFKSKFVSLSVLLVTNQFHSKWKKHFRLNKCFKMIILGPFFVLKQK